MTGFQGPSQKSSQKWLDLPISAVKTSSSRGAFSCYFCSTKTALHEVVSCECSELIEIDIWEPKNTLKKFLGPSCS